VVPQNLIDEHAEGMATLASSYVEQVAESVDLVIADVVGHLASTKKLSRATISGLPQFVAKAIDRSGYYSVAVAFASDLSQQVGEFLRLYREMGGHLPGVELTDAYMDELTDQAVAASSVIEAEAARVVTNVGRSTSHSIGALDAQRVAKGVSEDIRRLSKVEPIFLEQQILFFRNVGRLVYSDLEASGRPPRYSYVGPSGDGGREFCKNLLSGGKTHSLSDILAMDNEQVGDALVSCGGYGCMHWWAVAA
jgi:hypothetical protein